MSKAKSFKRKQSKAPVDNNQDLQDAKKLTPEEAALIIKNRLANRPVIVWRYPNGKYNKRFIITLAVMIVACIVAVYFFARTY